MRNILFIFIIFGLTCNAQTLTKVVNGVTVPLTQQEITAIQAEWTANELIRINDSIADARSRVVKGAIVQTAQTAVGLRYDNLTAAQVRALFGIVLYKEGAIDTALRIKPLNQWVK